MKATETPSEDIKTCFLNCIYLIFKHHDKRDCFAESASFMDAFVKITELCSLFFLTNSNCSFFFYFLNTQTTHRTQSKTHICGRRVLREACSQEFCTLPFLLFVYFFGRGCSNAELQGQNQQAATGNTLSCNKSHHQRGHGVERVGGRMGEERSLLPIILILRRLLSQKKIAERNKEPNGIHGLVQRRTSVTFVNWKYKMQPFHRRNKPKKTPQCFLAVSCVLQVCN